MDTVFVILQSSQRSQILHKKISTHLLTLLIMGVILHLEQRKGNKRTEDAENGIGVLRKLFFEPDKMTTTSEKDSQKA